MFLSSYRKLSPRNNDDDAVEIRENDVNSSQRIVQTTQQQPTSDNIAQGNSFVDI
jgi:hypothetical protein